MPRRKKKKDDVPEIVPEEPKEEVVHEEPKVVGRKLKKDVNLKWRKGMEVPQEIIDGWSLPMEEWFE